MSHIEKEKLIKADIGSIENKVRHTFNQGYDLGFKDGKERAKALEQEPCGDAINRQAVKELYYKDGYIDFRKICELPPVNPQEPKTGYREYNDIYDHYLCGNCKTVVMDYDNFCPNCGFRMVEPQERNGEE